MQVGGAAITDVLAVAVPVEVRSAAEMLIAYVPGVVPAGTVSIMLVETLCPGASVTIVGVKDELQPLGSATLKSNVLEAQLTESLFVMLTV